MKNGIARSPLFYVGDKYKLVREIKSHFPQHIGRLIEPFVGGGSVMMNVEADSYLLNDLDSYVVSIHRMLCSYIGREEEFFSTFFALVRRYGLSLSFLSDDVPQQMKKSAPKKYFAIYNKVAYNRLKADFNVGGRNDMLMLYALLVYGFNRMLRFNKKGDFNLPVGDVDFNRNTKEALDDYFRLLSRKQTSWHSEDFRDFLAAIDYQRGDLVYLDPPYLISSSEYNKYWNEATERELLALLDNLDRQGVNFAVSNVTHYRGRVNEVFRQWSQRYCSFPIDSNYISFNDNSVKQFNEVLVTNFEAYDE